MKEYITKDRAKQFVCGHCNEVYSEEPCEPSDCDWMAFIDKEPAADVVSKGLYEQTKWERDVALAQLEEYGVSLGEKADVAEVVRCKDCKWYSELACGEGKLLGSQGWCNEVMARPMPSNGFCSFRERKKGHGQTNGIQNGT